eukprot:2018258-Rhodomonas_salina.1
MPVLLQPFVDRFGTCTKTVIFVLGGFETLLGHVTAKRQETDCRTHCRPGCDERPRPPAWRPTSQSQAASESESLALARSILRLLRRIQ